MPKSVTIRRGSIRRSGARVPVLPKVKPIAEQDDSHRRGTGAQSIATEADNWDQHLGFLMHDVSRLRRSVFDEYMKPSGVTRSQWWILAYLSRRDGMIQSDLAGLLDLGKAALGGLIDRLEASGFIKRHSDSGDRRAKRVYLSARGAQMVREMGRLSHQMSEQILEGLDRDARHSLADMLGLVKANLLRIQDTSRLKNGN